MTLDVYEMSVPQKMLCYFVAGLIIYSHIENKESYLLKINEIYHWLLFAEQRDHIIVFFTKKNTCFIQS